MLGFVGFLQREKQKKCLASCYISTLFLQGEIIIMTKKHLMVDIPRPKSISKSSLLTTSALDLICHFTALSPSVVFYPKTIFTCCNSTVPSPHLGSSATFRLKTLPWKIHLEWIPDFVPLWQFFADFIHHALGGFWVSFLVPLNFLLFECHCRHMSFLMGELWSLIHSNR